jgi:hypothetical protein
VDVRRSVVTVRVAASPARRRASVSQRISWASLHAAAARSRLPACILTMFKRRSSVFFKLADLVSSTAFLSSISCVASSSSCAVLSFALFSLSRLRILSSSVAVERWLSSNVEGGSSRSDFFTLVIAVKKCGRWT